MIPTLVIHPVPNYTTLRDALFYCFPELNASPPLDRLFIIDKPLEQFINFITLYMDTDTPADDVENTVFGDVVNILTTDPFFTGNNILGITYATPFNTTNDNVPTDSNIQIWIPYEIYDPNELLSTLILNVYGILYINDQIYFRIHIDDKGAAVIEH